VEAIADDDDLYRRLAPDHIQPDGTVNSNAFKWGGRPDQSISVDLARLTSSDEALTRAPRPGCGLGLLKAGVARSLGFSVRHNPLPDNPSHALIEGENTRETCRALARATSVMIPPGRNE
jgi:hypothetical protein